MEKGLEGTLWSLSCLKEYSQKWSEKQAGRKNGFAQIKLAPCKYKCGIYILIYYSYLRIATYLRLYLGANLCESIFSSSEKELSLAFLLSTTRDKFDRVFSKSNWLRSRKTTPQTDQTKVMMQIILSSEFMSGTV